MESEGGMSSTENIEKYDDVLTSILVNEKSIIGFLSTIFNFLARRTDFYYVPEGEYENMGFPPGVAEELVMKVLRKCDPKTWKAPNGARKPTDVDNEIMCSTVAQEVEVTTEGNEISHVDDSEVFETSNELVKPSDDGTELETEESKALARVAEDDGLPIIHLQNSESYNGAVRDKYTWSQTITELDVIVKLPPNTKAKDLKITINSGDICVAHRNGEIIIKDNLPHKIKTIDSFWSISEGQLLMHLEKVEERWWNKLLEGEEAIDLSKIDASRPLHDLPEDHVAKVRELQWNELQKRKGLPTTDQIKNIEILRKAWNAKGSPFHGKEFDPSVLQS